MRPRSILLVLPLAAGLGPGSQALGSGRRSQAEHMQETDPAPRAKKESPRPDVGYLNVRAIDSQTMLPLPQIRVRAVSPTRIADSDTKFGTSSIQLKLTPGTYDCLVLREGYEPCRLVNIQIESGRTMTFEPLLMRGGTASIVGTVEEVPSGDQSLWVELRGEGRRPCPNCPTDIGQPDLGLSERDRAWLHYEACPFCGYGCQSSRRRLEDHQFTFQNLASGLYVIRLMGADYVTVGVPTVVALQDGELLPVSLEYIAPRTVRVEILDTDGQSLASEWSRRVRKSAASHEEDLMLVDPLESRGPPWIDCSFRVRETPVAKTWFSAPPIDPSKPLGRVFSHATRCSFHFWQALDDGPRGECDELELEAAPPEVEPCEVLSGVDAEGLVWIKSVPSIALTLEVMSGCFVSTVDVPASTDVVRIGARLKKVETPESKGERPVTESTFRECELARSR